MSVELREIRQIRPCFSCAHCNDDYGCTFEPASKTYESRHSLFFMRIKGVPPESRESEGMKVDATVTKEIPCIYNFTVNELKEIIEKIA